MITEDIVELKQKVLVVPLPMAASSKKQITESDRFSQCVYINRKKARAKIVKREQVLESQERAFALFPMDDGIRIDYLQYTMNALVVDYAISRAKENRELTAKIINEQKIALIGEGAQKIVAVIENLIQKLENLSDDQRAQDVFFDMKKSLLSQVHNAICVQLYLPSICENEQIDVFKEWKMWVEDSNGNYEIEKLIHYMLSPGNSLMGEVKNLQVAVSHRV
ncbi:MAG: hypothetical protein KBT27_13910 [Prevotellaceae bacterium]|nr:hypothetical protein [Candidatus Faecinaster equi]